MCYDFGELPEKCQLLPFSPKHIPGSWQCLHEREKERQREREKEREREREKERKRERERNEDERRREWI
jgi:hypothetical protein